MRLRIVYEATGEEDALDEDDVVLGADTPWLDVKGLIKMWTGVSMARQALSLDGAELPDGETLGETGLVSQAKCDEVRIVLHTTDDADDAGGEFTHADFIKLQGLRGRGVAVTEDSLRGEEVRRERRANQLQQSRVRPAQHALPKGAKDGGGSGAGAGGGGKKGEVWKFFEKCWHGMRREGTDAKYRIDHTGITQEKDHDGKPTEPFDYWDLRIAECPKLRARHDPGEIVLELFYFGFHMPGKKSRSRGGTAYPWIHDEEEFKRRIASSLKANGMVVPDMSLAPLRDAGCMYPLVAVAARVTEAEANELGHELFEDFGKEPKKAEAQPQDKGGKGGGCGQQ